MIEQFIEKDYLEMNPDVAQAVEKGILRSAYDHYISYGKAEGRPGMKTFDFVDLKSFPEFFLDRIKIRYPTDMEQPFEEWFYDNFSKEEDLTKRTYLPIFWTGFHVNNNFGKNETKMKLLQDFVDSLDRGKKYYTILNYDDGCLIDFRNIDILIFTASGKGGNSVNSINYPIPLLTTPHPAIDTKKDIFCSFVGKFENHPIRQRIFELFQNDRDFYFSPFTSMGKFCEITARSKFVLCPRGYGLNSFRMMEALQYGAIPVYISDFHTIPFGIEDYFIKVYDYQVSSLKRILTDRTTEYDDDMIENGQYFYENYCQYPALKEKILNVLKNE